MRSNATRAVKPTPHRMAGSGSYLPAAAISRLQFASGGARVTTTSETSPSAIHLMYAKKTPPQRWSTHWQHPPKRRQRCHSKEFYGFPIESEDSQEEKVQTELPIWNENKEPTFRRSRGRGARGTRAYLCSKSTGAFTSCTRKYFASAGYFLATASYIAYATLRYDTCPAGVVRSSEM